MVGNNYVSFNHLLNVRSRLLNVMTHVETVVLLSKKVPNDYLEVSVELDDDFLTKAEAKGI